MSSTGVLHWYRILLVTTLVAGCGNDQDLSGGDAPPPGTPIVTITTPRANESFYMAQTATVTWSVMDDGAALTCDVTGGSGGANVAIATNVATAPNVVNDTPWQLASLAPAESYTVTVTCRDANSPPLVGAATSGIFTISAPPQAVSYAAQIQPLWSKCTGPACHDATMPQAMLNLTASASHAQLVGVRSTQCTSTDRVMPGAPNQSYLVFKLQGSGPCYMGTRMPRGTGLLTATQMQLVRDWIANGAPDN